MTRFVLAACLLLLVGLWPDPSVRAATVTCPALPAVTPPAGSICAVTSGTTSLRVQGRILAGDDVLVNGTVFADGTGTIQCVGCDCSATAGFAGATAIVCPEGVVSPGLIDATQSITFSQNQPASDTGERYEHRHDWRTGSGGHLVITAAGGATANQVRWGELRSLLAGVTSMVGSGSAAGLVRNVDTTANGNGLAGQLLVDPDRFPLGDSNGLRLDGTCTYAETPVITPTDVASMTIGEGIDRFARNELRCLSGAQTDVIAALPIVGLAALDGNEANLLARRGTTVVWTPRHLTRTYGHPGNAGLLARQGVPLTLGSFWTVTGSTNLQRELACADDLAREYFPGSFDDRALWRMASANAAQSMKLDDLLGLIAVGRLADLVIFDGRTRADYRAVIDAEPADVRAVLRGSRALFGEPAVVSALNTGCEAIDVCGEARSVCTLGETALTFAQLQAAAGANAPPAFSCFVPPNEPTCVPLRGAVVSGSTIYSGAKVAADTDGDGIANAADNCPATFNPVRPRDAGVQSDVDGDGIGDECDGCSVEAGQLACPSLFFRDSFED